MKGFVIFLFCILGFSFCLGTGKNQYSDPYSLETLGFLEEVLLDFWSHPESKEKAISRLRYVCRNQDSDDGFLCYTWGLYEYRRGNYEESYSAFEKALDKNPDDTSYKNMLRLSAEKSGNLKNLSEKNEEGKVLAAYSETLQSCKIESKKQSAFPGFLQLAKAGHITKDMLKKGSLADCFATFTESEKSEILPFITNARIQYSKRLVEDRVKSDPFSKVWDTSLYHQGDLGKSGSVYVHPISEAWRQVREAAIQGNESSGREHLKSFLAEIQKVKKKGKTEASLALALERSAKLLLEQDPHYSRLRNLSKEF
ncbi:tetratricopeptide repeat protein [Leptospira idonii]|uniref:Tetratricopeptide repeat protein n=1 Tax=Leptospira idonii TaxID=1193500 RepID=A0A4R9M0E3_9LEPT|nr:tetratricopeptide repeat protein [Leptospira idonii]TGN19502.1 tetratricopeptide repeat protein [Leptospira idonii]